jgi:Uma2 family endonuclease
MAAATQISVAEYLNTTYRPDREYVDGQILERNLGEYEHSRPQMRVSAYFFAREKEWRVRVVPEQRVQVTVTRFRVPDVCVLLEGSPVESIFRQPPFLCIEILSKDDSFKSITERLDDYLAMGVPNVWVIEPLAERAYCYDGSFTAPSDGILRTTNPAIEVPLSALFD